MHESTETTPSSGLAAKNETWRNGRKRNAAQMIGLGIVGLAVPVIPGALLIGGGVWLLFPDQTEKAWKNLKAKLGVKK